MTMDTMMERHILEPLVCLGDNCIQNFNLGRYIVGYTVRNSVLWRRPSGAVKHDFPERISSGDIPPKMKS